MHHNSWSIDTDQRVIIAAVLIVKIFVLKVLKVLKFHFKKLNALKLPNYFRMWSLVIFIWLDVIIFLSTKYMDISNFVLTLGTTGPSSSQSSSHTPRRQNTIDSSSTKENALSGRKTPSGGPIMESPKVGNSGEQQLMKSYYCSKNSSRIISHFCNI